MAMSVAMSNQATVRNLSQLLEKTVAFYRGQELLPTNLYIRYVSPQGLLVDPYHVTYAIYQVQDSGTEVLVSPTAEEQPVRMGVGYYYIPGPIPGDWPNGSYRLHWNTQETAQQPQPTIITEDFNIISYQAVQPDNGNPRVTALVKSLRVLLRDNDPDRNYHFRPPTTANFLHQQTKKFGVIWTDDELLEYLQMSVDLVNGSPPATGFLIDNFPDRARTLVIYGGAYHALIAVTLNWIEEEFDYSIGGISLSIDKAAKYQGMKDNIENLWTNALEKYKATIKIHKGLQQPRFNPGARSLFGPYTGRNVLSVRQLVAPQRMAKP